MTVSSTGLNGRLLLVGTELYDSRSMRAFQTPRSARINPWVQPLTIVAEQDTADRALALGERAVTDELQKTPLLIVVSGCIVGCEHRVRGLTGADTPECFALLGGQRMPPSRKELLSVLAEDIGCFQTVIRHLLSRTIGFTGSVSKGL
jgi:hypothetical protein